MDLDAVLTALHDEDCRQLLEATFDDALTARELGERCDIPTSTVYRKLELLDTLGLLEASMRICENGDHAKEYAQTLEEITICIDDREGLNVEMSTVSSPTEYETDLTSAQSTEIS